jgi:DNA-directed RNA polymerase subunit K/omega
VFTSFCLTMYPQHRYLPEYLTNDAAFASLPDIARLWPLTKFEVPMVISTRACALAQGSAPTVACPADHDVIDTATKELYCGTLPPTRVVRYLPDESAVCVRVEDAFRASRRMK